MPIEKILPRSFLDEERLNALKSAIPEAFADGKIRWDVIKEALEGRLEDEGKDAEHFGLFWPGKREARRLASKPSKGSLIPCLGEGVEEETTGNIFIEGENLEVLKLLRKSYTGRVKMIYIDPPYNTGNDFVYDDDFTEPLNDYLKRTGQMDGEGRALTTNKKADGRFHSKWLSMMYPRLRLARELLRDDGVIFVSIDDNEVHHLRMLMNEVFGEENFVSTMVWDSGRKNDSKQVSVGHEYIVVCQLNAFADIDHYSADNIWKERKDGIDDIYKAYENGKKTYFEDWEKVSLFVQEWFKKLDVDHPAKAHEHYRCTDKNGVYFPSDLSGPDDGRKNRPRYQVLHPITKKPVPIPSRGWRWEEPRMEEELLKNRVHFGIDENTIPNGKVYLKENEYQAPSSVFYKDRRSASKLLRNIFESKVFEFPKDLSIVKRLCNLVAKSNDIILDFFSGSATTAHAVLDLNKEDGGNRKFVLVQMPETTPDDSEAAKAGYKTIAEIGKERIRRVIKKIKQEAKEAEPKGKKNSPGAKTKSLFENEEAEAQTEVKLPADLGFKVLKLAKSHLKPWEEYSGDDLKKIEGLFSDAVTPLVPGWQKVPDGLFTEILLLEGYPLDSTITERTEFAANAVREVSCPWHEKKLLVCLDEEIKAATVKALTLSDSEIFVCLDSAIDGQTRIRLGDKGLIKTI